MGQAQAQAPPSSMIPEAPADRGGSRTYYLEVLVNGWPVDLVARFREGAGRLSLPADQFEGLGFRLDEAWVVVEGHARRVYLDSVPNLTWRIDQRAQTIAISAPFALLAPSRIAISPAPDRIEAQAGRGAMFSYDLFGEWAADPDAGSYGRDLSSWLEARLFTPRYTFLTTGSVGWSGGAVRAVRYETHLTFDDQDRARTLRIGDSTTEALIWTRNTRFAGVQYQRNYGLRPDIVPTSMPVLSDGVTTPSVMNLYVNGVKRFAGDLPPGAFQLNHLPVLTGANEITMVLTDIEGRERTVTLPFYVNTLMLARGMTDFSFEAGAVREEFGTQSNAYGLGFVSGVWRRGLTDALTVEVHGEVARGLAMGGVAFGGAIGSLFAVGGAFAVSSGDDDSGTLWAIAMDRTAGWLSFSARHEVASAGFRDVAALTGQPHPRVRDTATVGLNLRRAGNLNVGYVSEIRGDGVRTPVATASYGVDLFGQRARLMANAYSVLNQHDQWGVGVTVSIPLGRNGLASAGSQRRREGQFYEAEARWTTMDDRLSWQLRDVEGPVPSRTIEARWDGSHLDARARVLNDKATSALQVEAAQSLVLFDGGLYVADRVDDAFAVVQVGRNSGVEVFRENQPVGRTDRRGRLFVNHLRAYEGNGLSIDPEALPLDASLESTAKIVAPRAGAGAAVTFAVAQERSALVTVILEGGETPPAGAEARLGDRVFPMGYGGEVYLRGLVVGRNLVQVAWRDHTCEVAFTLPDDLGSIVKLGPYTCA